DLKYIHTHDTLDALGAAIKQAAALGVIVRSWQPEVPATANVAKQIALELIGRAVIINAGHGLYPAAEAWKKACNLHAGQLAWAAELTEAEVLGWTKQPPHKPFAVVELRSELEDEATRRRFTAVER